jgi:UPF0716 protein FxsA
MRYTGAIIVALIVVEIAAAVAVAHAISWPLTLLLLVILSVVGVDQLRREGWAAFRARRGHQSPERQLGNAAAGVLAAGLVAVPGFVTGLLGIIGLTPPGRALVRRMLAHRFAAHIVVPMGDRQRRRQPPDDPRVVDGSLADPKDVPVNLRKDRPTL